MAALALGVAASAYPQEGADAAGGPRHRAPSVTIAILPNGTDVGELARVRGVSPGLLSAGIGQVAPQQTWLDIGQGNRTSQSLYDPAKLPPLEPGPRGVGVRRWRQVTARAASAPAEIVPGLLASSLRDAGAPVGADPGARSATLIAADRKDVIEPRRPVACSRGPCPGLLVRPAQLEELPDLVAGLRGEDLLVALERPPTDTRVLSLGIAGEGFDGILTSDATRTPGIVTAPDLTATLLERYGLEPPAEVNGEPIFAKGEILPAEVADLGRRFELTRDRRTPVLAGTLGGWLALALLALVLWGRRGARAALPLLALSAMYLPVVLLLVAALEPSLPVELAFAALGCPALAALTLRLAPGWPAIAIAALATVVAHAVDVVAGSALTPLSLLGPNPASGSRFFGIGNEIEAIVAVLLPLGVGAALAARPATRDGGRAAALALLGAGFAAAVAFAAGRFGADVGAAIVLPVGGAVAAAVAGRSRRLVAVALLAPVAGLVGLVAFDMVAGGEAHLTSSVLEAGGPEQAGDALERRVRLAAQSFTKLGNLPFLALAAGLAVALIVRRRTVTGWFAERAALAGFGGALAATAVGMLANDSGATVLIIGAGYLALAAGYAWAIRDPGYEQRATSNEGPVP